MAAKLYYGDEKLQAPEYDYFKLFQKDPNPVEAQLGSEQTNSAYVGRPDERPWSERQSRGPVDGHYRRGTTLGGGLAVHEDGRSRRWTAS